VLQHRDRRSAAIALCAIALAAVLTGTASAQTGGDGETFSPPRCATLRYGTVNLRVGPGFQYPIDWVLQRQGLPVEVTARYGPWRRVRLVDRTTGWVYERELADAPRAVAVGAIGTLRDAPAASGRPVARLEPGVVVDLLTCRDGWCSVDVRGFRGWIERRSLWGVCP
jgi:SH3-like domain-containing protein